VIGQANPVRYPAARRAALWCVATLLCSGAAHAAEGGLVLTPDWGMLFGLVALFVVLVFPLDVLLFRPLLRALEERDERITGTRAKAEKLERETQAVLLRYEAAIAEARAASETERRARLNQARTSMLETTSGARGEAERELERARGELATILDQARATLRGQAQELAREAASRVLGRAL